MICTLNESESNIWFGLVIKFALRYSLEKKDRYGSKNDSRFLWQNFPSLFTESMIGIELKGKEVWNLGLEFDS